MREEAYERYVQKTELTHRATSVQGQGPFWRRSALHIRRLMTNPETMGDILGKGNVSAIENMTLLLGEANEEIDSENDGQSSRQFPQLYEMAKVEGDWISSPAAWRPWTTEVCAFRREYGAPFY
jgi:hypothetical protein